MGGDDFSSAGGAGRFQKIFILDESKGVCGR
jgi:hypothetical protein